MRTLHKSIPLLLMTLPAFLGGAEESLPNDFSTSGTEIAPLLILAIFLLLVVLAAYFFINKKYKKALMAAVAQREKALADEAALEVQKQRLTESVRESQEAARTKSSFLATMSHEIRTPLNAIIGFADFLDRPDVPPEKQREYAKSLNTVANALLALINDVLDLSKLDSGNADTLNLQQGATEMPRLFEEMQTIFQLKAAQKGLKLEFHIDKDMPCIVALEPRIRQILLNTIGNAIKYTLKGSVTVTCETKPCEDFGYLDVKLMVKDTGIGISPEGLKKVFDPFSQDISSRQGKVFTGTGLGLAIVKRLLEAAGGTIQVDSVLGEGSTFTICLNHMEIRKAPERQSAPQKFRKDASKHEIKNVVLIDDIPMNRKILGMYLKSLGIASPEDFATAKEALHYLESHTPDLVLTDMWMPEMDGVQFARQAKIIQPDLPIAVVTADADISSTFNTSDFVAILTKPVTAQKLKELFQQLQG